MSSKTEACYIDVFKFIEANLFHLKPTTFQSDFETALKNACKKVYPLVIMKPCWFHYMQALKRNANQIPMFKRFLNSNAKAYRHFRKFLFLPLLKPSDFIAAYEILKKTAINNKEDFAVVKEGESIFHQFIKYFDRQWIKKVNI